MSAFPTPHTLLAGLALGLTLITAPARAADVRQEAPPVDTHAQTYSEDEMVVEAGRVFGSTAKGMADAIHSVFKKYGEPNAYIKGEEASGAFVLGLRYGTDTLNMKSGGSDFGGNAVKVFTLIYNLPNGDKIYQRFPGVEGSAYLVAGVGINYQQRENIILAPMRAGAGLRLGASVGYLKYTKSREWLPF